MILESNSNDHTREVLQNWKQSFETKGCQSVNQNLMKLHNRLYHGIQGLEHLFLIFFFFCNIMSK